MKAQNATAAFRALFDNGVIIEWYAPQTWGHVIRMFKLAGTAEGHGVLYTGGGVRIRETGTEVQG